MNKRTLACLGLACLLAAPAFAQPDFAATFKRLDRNDDGLIALDEIRWEGADLSKYLEPAGVYKTDDGFGIELWLTPFGVRQLSTEAALLDGRAVQRARTYPRDRRVDVVPYLMLAGNPELRTMTPERFETELRRAVQRGMELDLNGDGGISTDEIRSNAATNERLAAERPSTFQGGPGGDAMRARKLALELDVYASFDRDGDGKATQDEILESWLANLVGAFAMPEATSH
jgi:Ca2+-binding EF-hand superfamily protein